MDFNPSAVHNVIQLPTGWDKIDGPGFIMAMSLNPGAPPVGTDIGPGESLSDFTFQFDYQAGNCPFEVHFVNPSDPGNPVVYSDTSIPGTTPIPEPSTILLFGFGFLGLLGVGRIKKMVWKG